VTQQAGEAERQIRALIEAWADAAQRHDLPAILAHHEDDIVMFDLPPPLQSKGMEAYKATWDLFFKAHTPSRAFDIEELTVTAGDDVAFAFGIIRCETSPAAGGSFPFRLTVGLRKVGAEWHIVHEHHSIPAVD
jgi:ketosteroid isomerase-like protein